MAGMFSYPKAAMERAMKVQEVILRAMARKITWWQAAEIIGISDRHMRRWRERYEEFGYDGLFDRRRGKPSPKRVPLAWWSGLARGRKRGVHRKRRPRRPLPGVLNNLQPRRNWRPTAGKRSEKENQLQVVEGEGWC